MKDASNGTDLEPSGVIACGCAAGVYTSSILVPLCATLLESFGALNQLANYVSLNGRKFYGYDDPQELSQGTVTLRRSQTSSRPVPAVYVHPDFEQTADSDVNKIQVVPFWAGRRLAWEIVQT